VSVYFVYRSQYQTPILNQLKVFPDASVLEWFQSNWQQLDENLLGFDPYGFDSLNQAIESNELPSPSSIKELQAILEEHLYVENTLLISEHAIQVLTDDDELDCAYYIFDETYLQSNREKAEFLTLPTFDLPTEFSLSAFNASENVIDIGPAGTDEGELYFVFASYYDAGGQLEYLNGAARLPGVRLPQFLDYLSAHTSEPVDAGWPEEFETLRQVILNTRNSTAAGRSNAAPAPTAPTLTTQEGSSAQELDRILRLIPSDNPAKCRIQTAEHVAQLGLCADDSPGFETYCRWIMFDDLFAGANTELANSILRYGNRWDVLS